MIDIWLFDMGGGIWIFQFTVKFERLHEYILYDQIPHKLINVWNIVVAVVVFLSKTIFDIDSLRATLFYLLLSKSYIYILFILVNDNRFNTFT